MDTTATNNEGLFDPNELLLLITFSSAVGGFLVLHGVVVSRAVRAFRKESKRTIGAANSEVVVIRDLLKWLHSMLILLIALELPIIYEYIANPRRVVVPGNIALGCSGSKLGIAVLGFFAVYRPFSRLLFFILACWCVAVNTVFEAFVNNRIACITMEQCPVPGDDEYGVITLLVLKGGYVAAIVLWIWLALIAAYLSIAWGVTSSRYSFQHVVYPELVSEIPMEIRQKFNVKPARATRRLSKSLEGEKKSLLAFVKEFELAK